MFAFHVITHPILATDVTLYRTITIFDTFKYRYVLPTAQWTMDNNDGWSSTS